MTYDTVENGDGTTTINMNFADENIDLQGQINVKGDNKAAMVYLPVFEKDMRRNFSELFPLPEMPEGGREI